MEPLGSSASFQTTLLNEAPSNIQKEGDRVVLNFPLTIPEEMFLAFVAPMIEAGFAQKCRSVYLGTSKKMQSDFHDWVQKTYKKQISSEELNLLTIISSIWMKTKTFIENKINIHKNKKLIENERQCQNEADRLTKAFRLDGLSGKVFTHRQANFLLTEAKSIGK